MSISTARTSSTSCTPTPTGSSASSTPSASASAPGSMSSSPPWPSQVPYLPRTINSSFLCSPSLFSFSFLPPLLPSLFSSHYYHNGSKPRDSVPLRRLCFVIPLATAHVSGIAHSSPCHNGSISHNSVTLWQT